jgi:hypothetical protein
MGCVGVLSTVGFKMNRMQLVRLVVGHQFFILFVRQDPLSGNIALSVVGLAELGDGDALIRCGMIKIAISNVDAYMRDAFAICVEKHKIAGAKLVLSHFGT